MIIIAVLLLAAVFKRRAIAANERALAVHRDEGGMSWIYVGVVISTVVLVACAIWTMFTIAAVAMPAQAGQLNVQITGSQWWWNARYMSGDSSQIFSTANEIHIPVGQPVRIELVSTDVIHSFWIPQLAGKTDVVPGQTNVMWLQADRPGTYRGQCTEYCGLQHAHMAMFVIADTPSDYERWFQGQVHPAAAAATPELQRGEKAFVAHCGACHTVRGTGAGGIFGPDLTHVMSRTTIAAGVLPNNHANLLAWVVGAQALKPGTLMPALAISGDEANAIVAYLDTLH